MFVSTLALFGGPPSHEPQASGTNPDRWMIEPGDSWLLSSLYHPNARGWLEEAELLYRDRRVPKADVPAAA